MDFETFNKLIEDGDIESIANILADLSEQEQNDLVDMLSPEQAIKLIAMVNTPNTAVAEETQLSDNSDVVNEEESTSSPAYVYEKVKEEDYPEILSIFEKNGYGKEEMDDWLNSKLTDIGDQFAELDSFISSEPDTKDVNGDGDTDVATADTNGNGEKDTAVVTADSEPEKKEAVKAAKEDLGLDKEDKTSTGKTKGELEDEPKEKDVVSDEKKKDMTCSDATQKNIMAALLDHRF